MPGYKIVPMTDASRRVEQNIRPPMRQAVTIPLEIEIDGKPVRSGVAVYVVESAWTLAPDGLSMRQMADVASIVADRIRHQEDHEVFRRGTTKGGAE